MTDIESIVADLPDPESARRFLSSLEELQASEAGKLKRKHGLLSDVLTLASYSPLLATTLLQNPGYIWWLDRKRRGPAIRTKDEILEALGRFVLTHSHLDLHTQLARFRRRELLRIFLSDIRRLTTIAEITEDISNLADAILETALRRAAQEMDNRFGRPEVRDSKGRKTTAGFCIVSLGKLGSRELNYSSDIDLLFLYSAEGETSGTGSRGATTNREYFVKLSEAVVQTVGKHTGEGAAYRVDMRLRPHGRVGALAISVDDAVRYYTGEARDWERQVLIRSRASAGESEIYKRFFEQVESVVFSRDVTVASALEGVSRSKQLIDIEQKPDAGLNVKLGRGGIREIEFIAQALQLAHGGKDRWLRASHTLISLSRLADRTLLTEAELTELFNAYEFLRHLEHVLQMENGLQTHTLPDDPERRAVISRRMRCPDLSAFESDLAKHTRNVRRVFERVFAHEPESEVADTLTSETPPSPPSDNILPVDDPKDPTGSPLGGRQPGGSNDVNKNRDYYFDQLTESTKSQSDFRHRLSGFRRRWLQLFEDIKKSELAGSIDIPAAKRAQTALAEASIDTALDIAQRELNRRYKTRIDTLPIALMGLGKLGGGAVDYGSDLDLVLVYGQNHFSPDKNISEAEFYGRAAEIFVTTLSSMTRDGSIYRVDLRLRPYGKNGQSVISAEAFTEYMRGPAAMWEWLAYVKIRAVAGDIDMARKIETTVRQIIHSRANEADPGELATETRRVRMRLEQERARTRRSKEIDIKYGSGGILDVYFAMRYLQLRDNVPDSADDRSTQFMLGQLHRNGSLRDSDHEVLLEGYRFLSALDHHLRLTVGRTTRLPIANVNALDAVSTRMNLKDHNALLEHLTLHRLNLRKSFDEIVK